MAKTIKFNIIVDGKPVRDLEDLRNNFAIEDILEYYHNGLLKRWLNVRGYDELFAEVNKIAGSTSLELIDNLIRIFEIEHDPQKIKEGVAILEFIEERKELLDVYEKRNFLAQSIIEDYHSGYDGIIFDIIQHKEDMPQIKAYIREIENRYFGLFQLNHLDMYYTLINHAPLAVFAIMMNEKLRKYFIKSDNCSASTIEIYEDITGLVANNRFQLKEYLGTELKIFKGDTQAYWKDLEPPSRKCLILGMANGNYVRSSGVFGEELTSKDVNGQYLILDGIDYKSNNSTHEFLYMEV